MHNEVLSDIVYPAEIVGKRIRVKLDGKRLIKVHLDKNQETNVGHKVSDWYPEPCISICIIFY